MGDHLRKKIDIVYGDRMFVDAIFGIFEDAFIAIAVASKYRRLVI